MHREESYNATSHRKVRNTVRLGPLFRPYCTVLRTGPLRSTFEVFALPRTMSSGMGSGWIVPFPDLTRST